MNSISESQNENHGNVIFWRIENFHCKIENNFLLSSPNFKLKRMEQKWQLEIKHRNGFLAAYLFRESHHSSTKAFISTALLTESGWNNTTQNSEVKYEVFRTGWGAHELINLENLEKQKSFYMPRKSLTISFRIWNERIKNESSQWLIISQMGNESKLSHQPIETFSCLTHEDMLYFLPSYEFQPNKTPKSRNSFKPRQDPTPKFSEIDECSEDDLLKLLKKKKFGFVTIRTSGKEFFVLKAVLCAESPVLKAMFETTDKDDCNNIVDVDDIESDTMTAVITFLHNKTLNDVNWDILVKLFYAAVKYQIGTLRRFCVAWLKKEISVENVCDALILATMHQNLQLLTYVQKYFSKNSDSILKSEKWKEFSSLNKDLAAYILGQLPESAS